MSSIWLESLLQGGPLFRGQAIAGLTAAAFAAKTGAKVTLLEGALTFGGRARTRVVDGYHFNQGAHALYRDGFLDEALIELGVLLSGGAPPLDGGCFVAGGKLHKAPFGAAALAETTLLTDPEKRDMAVLLRGMIEGRVTQSPGKRFSDTLAAISDSPRIRATLAAMVRLTSVVHAPNVADGAALLDQLRGALTRSARYIDGGWGAMVDGLSAACANLGVSLRSSAPVASIEFDAGWRVTLRDGNALSAQAVILAVGPEQAKALWPGFAMSVTLADAVPAKAACLDLGLAKLPNPDVLFALDVDHPLYFSVHSATAQLAPDGAALVHTVCYIEPGEKPVRDQLIARLEGFLDLVQPGWREQEQARQFLGAMPVYTSLPLAANHGVKGRPNVIVPDVDGLFVAGDWVGPFGMLADAAAASGRSAGEAAGAFAQPRK